MSRAAERFLEDAPDGVDVDVGVARGEPEVVDPDRIAGRGRDAVRPLLEHAQAHALEHRQAVGERHRRTAVEELEPQRPRRRFERPVQTHPQAAARGDRREHLAVGNRVPRRGVFPVRRGERRAAHPVQLVAARLAHGRDERLAQVVFPAARRGDEPLLQLADVELRDLSRRGAHGIP